LSILGGLVKRLKPSFLFVGSYIRSIRGGEREKVREREREREKERERERERKVLDLDGCAPHK